MGKMKELHMEVNDLYRGGMAPVEIANRLNIPLDMVFGALGMQTPAKEAKLL
jgi:hypothetical protein